MIVVDMWLTGFDVPCAHTMYLDKPLAGHNLMQAIARVNRVYGEKPGGLIVDLLGLADQFADALATYAQASGKDEEAFKKVQDEAVPAMQSAFEKLRGVLPRLRLYRGARRDRRKRCCACTSGAIDYVLASAAQMGRLERRRLRFRENPGRRRLRKLVKELSAAFALAVPRPETDAIAPHLAFFQRLVAMIHKRLADETGEPRARFRPARHRCGRAAGHRRRGGRGRGDRPVRGRRPRRGAAGHSFRRVPPAGVGPGAEEPGAGNAAKAAQRSGPRDRANEPRAQQRSSARRWKTR